MRAKHVSIEVATARGVADRWMSQYYRDGAWVPTCMGSSKEIHEKLCALGPTPAIDKVAEIIGNKSWSYISCIGCSTHVERGVRIRPEYDEGGVFCAECISEAHQILNGDGK